MKTQKIPILSLLLIALVAVSGYCQEYNKMVHSREASPQTSEHFFLVTPKVIKTNKVIKTADSQVPFDQPFFLQVSRPKKDTFVTASYFISGRSEKTVITDRATGFFQESDTSDTVYLLIRNLKPDQQYIVEIQWKQTPVDSYYLTTIASTLKERAAARITPEIGYAMAFFRQGDAVFTKSSLALTVSYSIRPVDKDVPLGSYNKPYSLSRFSLMMGLATSSIAEEGVRQNLFGTNNLLVGVGYTPIQSVRLSYGAFVFNTVSPNKILASRENVAVTSYASITLDLNMKELLGGVVAALGFK